MNEKKTSLRMPMALLLSLIVIGATPGQKAKKDTYDSLLAGRVPVAVAKPPDEMHYRFVITYNYFTDTGSIASPPQTVVGEFSFRPPNGAVRWAGVTETTAAEPGKNSTVIPQPYMEGLSYTRADRQRVFSDEFLRIFPQSAHKERNLVWDQVMFDGFIDYVDQLRLNQPIKGPAGTVLLGSGGKFENREIELTWTGITRRNNEDCLVVHFEALMNHFQLAFGNVTVTARSDYWGDMWISVRSRQLQAGTLMEEVAGTLQIDQKRLPLQVLRIGKLDAIR